MTHVGSPDMKGARYCGAHKKKAVEITTGIDNRVYLKWCSLPMMWRFMAANKGRFTPENTGREK